MSALATLSLEQRADYVRNAGWDILRACGQTGELMRLEPPPDAIFCARDAMAIGALRMLNQIGATVPGGVAIVGFDDTL